MSSRSIEVDFKTRMIARILDCLPKTVKKYRSQKVPIVALLDNFTPYLLEKFCNGNELSSNDFLSSAVNEKDTQKILAGIKEKKQRKEVERAIYADKTSNFSLLIRSAFTKVKEDEKQFGPFRRNEICKFTYMLIAEKKGLLELTSEEIAYIDVHGFENLRNLTEDDLRIWYIDMINKAITLEGAQKRWMK